MKRFSFVVVLLALLTVFTVGQAFAYPVSDGDVVSMQRPSNEGMYTGNYDVYDSNDARVYSAFCLQMETEFNWGTVYYATVDDQVLGYFTTDDNYPGPTAISVGAKALFWNYSLGTLDGYDGSSDDVEALQNAIWKLQGYTVVGSTANSESTDFYTLATGGSLDISGMNVKAMNLWESYSNVEGVVNFSGPHQSQLIAGAPVPEPATLILLGSGLAGLAFYRRKKK